MIEKLGITRTERLLIRWCIELENNFEPTRLYEETIRFLEYKLSKTWDEIKEMMK